MSVRIVKMSTEAFDDLDRYVDIQSADAELIADVNLRDKNIHAIYDHDHLVGVCQIKKGKTAYVYVFVTEKFRNKGIGTTALKLCEKALDNETEAIVTTYKLDDRISKAFANRFGYLRKFSSTFMTYDGPSYSMPLLEVRGYIDDDYELAHGLYAKAFHEMRVSVGDFPDSVVQAPSEKAKAFWLKTHKERMIHTKNNEIVAYARVINNEISIVAVKSEYQGQGIGEHFVKHICNKIFSEGYSTVNLFCVVGNKAKHLYDKLGFKPVYTADYAEKTWNQ